MTNLSSASSPSVVLGPVLFPVPLPSSSPSSLLTLRGLPCPLTFRRTGREPGPLVGVVEEEWELDSYRVNRLLQAPCQAPLCPAQRPLGRIHKASQSRSTDVRALDTVCRVPHSQYKTVEHFRDKGVMATRVQWHPSGKLI